MTNYMDIGYFGNWLQYGERGISSETIVSELTGVTICNFRGGNHPYDIGDFRRCELMLRNVEEYNPEVRARFAASLSQKSPQWAALVTRWSEIAEQMEAENDTAFTRRPDSRKMPVAGGMVRSILDEAVRA